MATLHHAASRRSPRDCIGLPGEAFSAPEGRASRPERETCSRNCSPPPAPRWRCRSPARPPPRRPAAPPPAAGLRLPAGDRRASSSRPTARTSPSSAAVGDKRALQRQALQGGASPGRHRPGRPDGRRHQLGRRQPRADHHRRPRQSIAVRRRSDRASTPPRSTTSRPAPFRQCARLQPRQLRHGQRAFRHGRPRASRTSPARRASAPCNGNPLVTVGSIDRTGNFAYYRINLDNGDGTLMPQAPTAA